MGTRTSLGMWMMENENFQFVCDDIEFTQKDVRRLTDDKGCASRISAAHLLGLFWTGKEPNNKSNEWEDQNE